MREAPQELFDEAFQLNYAVYRGVLSWQKVVSWADGWIERLDSWPDEITEISFYGRRKDSESRRHLATLAQRAHSDRVPEFLVRQLLMELENGSDPIRGVAELYHLVYDHFDTGGLEFQLVTPEPIHQAIYRLDHDVESTDPIYGWAKMSTLERHLYLQKRMKHELTQALDQIGG